MADQTAIDSDLVPRYVQAYSAMKDWIAQGKYPAGSRLPSEAELCKLFNVSRITVRAAVEMLEKQRLVERSQGRGTFVLENTIEAPSRGDFTELVRRLRTLSATSTLEDLEIHTRPASPEVATDLHLEPGEEVIQVSFVRYRDGEPTGVTNIYVPSALGVTFTADEIRSTPAPTLLESKGYKLSGAHQLIGASLADANVGEKLKTTAGAPIVTVRLQILDVEGQPVELLSAQYRADRYVHHVYLAGDAPGAPGD
jgi:GntR family transcriptional regulator